MYLSAPDVDGVMTAISALQPQPEQGVLILVGENASLRIDELIARLRETNYTFVGGIFPAVISAETHSESGVIVTLLPLLTQPYLICDLNEHITLPDFEKELEASESAQLTALVWIDGLTSRISNFLEELYSNLGNAVRYLGGGAGSLSLDQKPCIFTCEGCFQDAAVVMFSPLESQLGVRHGWQRLQGPFPATRTQGNIIKELNWKNAFQVYQAVIQADSQQVVTQANFFDIAKAYPFGIFKEGQEDIVRDPIIVNDSGELMCVGEVPENALLYILKGDKESLVDSARQAAIEATHNLQETLQSVLVIDCISRVLFLGDAFSEELIAFREQVNQTHQAVTAEGVLTLGEISSYGEGFLEFFNKTIVIGALH